MMKKIGTMFAVPQGPDLRTAALYAVAVATVLISSSTIPSPADAAENKERLLPPLVIAGTTEEGLYLYGQINKGVLFYDDGSGRRTYLPVDNSNSSTRLGAWATAKSPDGFSFSANLEFEWNPYATNRVNARNSDDFDWSTKKLRKAEAIMDTGTLGKFWAGQGSMVSDGSAEADLSGTSVAAYSPIGDAAGGQLIAFADGAGLSTVTIGSAFGNLDGLGRKVRGRYDTPEIGGLRLGASFGTDEIDGPDGSVWDVGASFKKDPGDISVVANAAYAQLTGDRQRFSGSVSTLHKPSGVNMTLAGGYEIKSGGSPSFLYGKLGWRPALTELGATAFAVDVYSGHNFKTRNSDSLSIGLTALQTLDYYQTDLYVTARWYDFDDDAASYESSFALLTGARLRF